MSVALIGIGAVLESMNALKSDGLKAGIADGIKKAADSVRDAIEAEAPKGPTGNLKRSVQSGMFKKRSGKPIAGFVRVNGKIAPHAHLVEFGARGGAMPANPFFSRGYAKSKDSALQAVEDALRSAIDKVW